MQTFAPLDDPLECARVLDSKRLNKQIVECLQIFRALTDPNYGWQNHPAVKMWNGHVGSLVYKYAACFHAERLARGGTTHASWVKLTVEYDEWSRFAYQPFRLPQWWGDDRIHSSHRANLLRKDPEHYGKFGWTEHPQTGYVWPTKLEEYAL